jgi:hypothetical protein
MLVGIFLTGCATGRFEEYVGSISPGVTNRDWIIASLGEPEDVVISMTREETLRYRSIRKGIEHRLDIRVNQYGVVTGYDWYKTSLDVEVVGRPISTSKIVKSADINDHLLVSNEARPQLRIVFLSGIELRGGTDEGTEKLKSALGLLQKKSGEAFSLIREELGKITISTRDVCDDSKTPAVLEISNETELLSHTWLAGLMTKCACDAKAKRRLQASEDCAKYQLKVMRQIGAPQDETDSVSGI